MSHKYEVFGKYLLLEKIAAGGMAEVYRAKAPGAEDIGKILAIKRILPQFSGNADFIEMFKTEAKIAINLTQANIGQIYEFGVQKELFFLVMEFIDGRNLRQLLSRCTKAQKALTIEQCVYIISQVANGLDYAHRCIDKNSGGPLNIIHRDMSPQNIMVSFEGEVKIVDFGIAKAESKIEVTRAGTLKGKFGYMSPEQAEGFDLDARTDIFSTGIVLWELLSGERLFVANSEVNTIRKIKECQIPSLRKINPHIHEELERITMKALAKDRNLRYQTSAELHRDLSRFLYRVNPEFTAHDLSIAVKSLFKEDILLDRKKNMEYARVIVPTKQSKASIEKTSPSISAITETNEKASSAVITQTEKATATDRGPIVPANEVRLDPNTINSRVELLNETGSGAYGNATKTHVRIKTVARAPLTTQSHQSYMPDVTKWAPTAIVALVVLLSGGYFIKNHDRIFESASGVFRSIGDRGTLAANQVHSAIFPSSEPEKDADLVATAPQPIKVHMMIHSVPPGAQINVDGEPMGTTPGEIRIDMNKKVNLCVRRDGFAPFIKEIVPTSSPEDYTVTLQRASLGYIDIDVQPTGAEIYIDNQKICEKVPVSRYPVQAGKNVTIRAVNPNLNTSAQQTILVKQDMVKSVTLFLSKSK